MQIDHFPSKYGCSPSITGAVPGTNLPEPQPRDWLQMYWRCISWNQPRLAGYLNQLTSCRQTWHRFLWYFWFEGRVVRCLARKTSTVAKNCPFPSNQPSKIAAYTSAKIYENIEKNAAPVLSRISVLQAVPALALVRLRGESPDEQIMSPWCTVHHRLVDDKPHATGKGPEIEGRSYQHKCFVGNSIWFRTAQKGGPTTFWKSLSPPFSPPRWHQKAYLCPYRWCQTWWSLNPEPRQFSGWFPKGTWACHGDVRIYMKTLNMAMKVHWKHLDRLKSGWPVELIGHFPPIIHKV